MTQLRSAISECDFKLWLALEQDNDIIALRALFCIIKDYFKLHVGQNAFPSMEKETVTFERDAFIANVSYHLAFKCR